MAGSWGAQLIGSGTVGGTATSAAVDCPGGICVFSVCGTFGGGTVALYMLGPDSQTWIPAGTNCSFTTNNSGVAYLPPGQIQAQISGATSAAIFASIARVVG